MVCLLTFSKSSTTVVTKTSLVILAHSLWKIDKIYTDYVVTEQLQFNNDKTL